MAEGKELHQNGVAPDVHCQVGDLASQSDVRQLIALSAIDSVDARRERRPPDLLYSVAKLS